MDNVLGGIQNESCLVYMNYIIMYSQTIREYLSPLSDDFKTSPVRKSSVTENKKNITSFFRLGAIIYYIIPNGAKISKPMMMLTRIETPFSFTSD